MTWSVIVPNLGEIFAKRARLRMAELNLSLTELATKLGVAHSNVSMYLSGKRNPGLKVIDAYSEALGVDSAWLMGKEKSESVRQIDVSNEEVVWRVAEKMLEDKKRLAILGLTLRADPELLETITDAVRPFLETIDKSKMAAR